MTLTLSFQSRDEEFSTDDSADEDCVNNYCYMFAKFNMPPDFKAFCTNRRSHYGNTNLYNTYYQWVSLYFMIQVNIDTK